MSKEHNWEDIYEKALLQAWARQMQEDVKEWLKDEQGTSRIQGSPS